MTQQLRTLKSCWQEFFLSELQVKSKCTVGISKSLSWIKNTQKVKKETFELDKTGPFFFVFFLTFMCFGVFFQNIGSQLCFRFFFLFDLGRIWTPGSSYKGSIVWLSAVWDLVFNLWNVYTNLPYPHYSVLVGTVKTQTQYIHKKNQSGLPSINYMNR